MRLGRFFPAPDQMLLVCGTVVAMIYTWTALTVTLDVTLRWRFLLDLIGIAIAYAYSFVAALVEAALVTGSIVLLSAILPRKVLREDFEVRGSLIAISLMGTLMALTLQPPAAGPTRKYLDWATWSLALGVVSVGVAAGVPAFRRFTLAVVERVSILLYLYGPLTALSLAWVLARNVG